MAEEQDKLATTPEAFKMKRPGIAGLRHRAASQLAQTDPQTVSGRIGIVFDDSGSMSVEPLNNAKQGTANFLAACNPLETSVAIYPLNAEHKDLTCQYDLINFYLGPLRCSGGTPLYTITMKALDDNLTRIIIFSDGAPTDATEYNVGEVVDTGNHGKTIAKAVEKKIPLDTVFIGEDPHAEALLRDLAEKTGGIFLKFSSTLTFSSQLKYLSPKMRGVLMNAELKAKVERGETI